MSESSGRVPVDVRRLSSTRRLAADYSYDFRVVAPFFAGNPAEPSAWTDAIARAQAHERRRDAMVTVVSAQQARRRAPDAARAATTRLADPRAVAIVTGQQAGLFGGPLYTLLKALTAIELADRVAREHHVPTVAIFWVDAEDHDWDEVRSCRVLSAGGELRTIALAPRNSSDPVPVASVRLDESIRGALDDLEAALPATEFRAPLLAQLREAYAPGVGMADAFAQWLEHTLGSRGLIVYDASDAASKPLVGSVFAREVSSPGETTRLAGRAGADLAARGYHAQVTPQDNQLALFHLAGGRRAIRQQGDHFTVGGTEYSRDALAREAAERPELFSPNVLLRPVVQDALFPTVCYVAGPSELAYLGQLRGVYAHFRIPMPLIYPRATATLVDAAALRFLTRYNLPLEALEARDDAALNALLEAEIPKPVEEAFSQATRTIAHAMDQLAQALPALDSTLAGAASSIHGRMTHDLDALHGKMIQAAKRRDEALRRQFVRVRSLVFPDGHAQERTVGYVWFLNQFGPALMDRLRTLPIDMGRHWVISV